MWRGLPAATGDLVAVLRRRRARRRPALRPRACWGRCSPCPRSSWSRASTSGRSSTRTGAARGARRPGHRARRPALPQPPPARAGPARAAPRRRVGRAPPPARVAGVPRRLRRRDRRAARHPRPPSASARWPRSTSAGRTHRHQSQQALGVMAAEVLAARRPPARRRAGRRPVMAQFVADRPRPRSTPRSPSTERPPVRLARRDRRSAVGHPPASAARIRSGLVGPAVLGVVRDDDVEQLGVLGGVAARAAGCTAAARTPGAGRAPVHVAAGRGSGRPTSHPWGPNPVPGSSRQRSRSPYARRGEALGEEVDHGVEGVALDVGQLVGGGPVEERQHDERPVLGRQLPLPSVAIPSAEFRTLTPSSSARRMTPGRHVSMLTSSAAADRDRRGRRPPGPTRLVGVDHRGDVRAALPADVDAARRRRSASQPILGPCLVGARGRSTPRGASPGSS